MKTNTTSALPQGMHTITPHLVVEGAADAIEFYRRAFGAEELARLPREDGRIMHALLRIGDSMLMMADTCPEWHGAGSQAGQGAAITLHLYVPDVDAAFQQALEAGAETVMPVADMFWGDRYGQLRDPFGQHWSMATRQRDVAPDEMQDAMRRMPPKAPEPRSGT